MLFFKKKAFLLAVIGLMIVLSGCSNSEKAFDDAEKYISSVEKMNIPDDVEIIGLGEATHGNVELQKIFRQFIPGRINRRDLGGGLGLADGDLKNQLVGIRNGLLQVGSNEMHPISDAGTQRKSWYKGQ